MGNDLTVMRMRAERAEARVKELEAELAALKAKAPKAEGPKEELVPIEPGKWEYRKVSK